jgi:hypothetical protein
LQEDIIRINAICNTITFRYTASPQPRRRTSSGLTPSATPTSSGIQPHLQVHSLITASQEDILRINAICNTNTFRYTASPSGTQPHHSLAGDILTINAICNTNTFRYTASSQPRRRTSSGLTPSATPTPSGIQPHLQVHSLITPSQGTSSRLTPSATPTPSGIQSHLQVHSLITASQEDILKINDICSTNTFRYTALPSGTQPHHSLAGDILMINFICNTNTFRYTALPSGTQPHHSRRGHPHD